jgi:hypothetical protein
MVENKRYILEWFPFENTTYAKCQVYGLVETFRSFAKKLDDISKDDSCKP